MQTVISALVIYSRKYCLDITLPAVVTMIGLRPKIVCGVTHGAYYCPQYPDAYVLSQYRAIEENVRRTCAHLVEECIVVGHCRPSPALFVEPVDDVDHIKLKGEIIHLTQPFHSRRYLHERIASPDFIIVVPSRSLPRTVTKGNIRRRAVEEQYKAELDQIYNANCA
jgi:hypothetical protein